MSEKLVRAELRLCADGGGYFFGRCLHRDFGRELFPVATFLQAGMNGANFCFLLHDKTRAAFRARFRDGHVGRRKIAIGIARAAIENSRPPAAAFTGAAAADEFSITTLRTFNTQSDRPRIFALRIAGAADEFAEAAMLLDESVAAESALFVERLVRLPRDARALDETPRGLAIRIALAREKNSEAAALDGHLLAAIVAIFDFWLAGIGGELGRKILDEIAIGIAGTAQKESVPADTFEQLSLAALFALFASGDACLVGKHFIVGAIQIDYEFLPKFLHGFAPVQLAFFNFIELFL